MNTVQLLKDKISENPRTSYPLLVLMVGIVGTVLLLTLRKSPPKIIPKSKSTLVRTIVVEPEQTIASISVYGTTRASRDLSIQPQVSGQIVKQHPELISGGRIKQGELILQIDPRDYEAALLRAKADLARAEFDLEMEKGNQIVAQQEWELLDPELRSGDLSKRLALRKPHLKQKEAALLAAKSALHRAQIDLDRTKITAPFDSIVLEEDSEVGKFANTQSSLARIVDSSEFFVEASIPIGQLTWVEFPGKNVSGSKASVQYETSNGIFTERSAEVVKLLGALEQTGRMARILVSVKNPLEDSDGKASPLLLGTYVEVVIEGKELSNIFLLPDTALREGGTVWIKNEQNKLRFQKVGILLHRRKDVIVSTGLKSGDEIVVSPVPGALPGLVLETEGNDE